MESPVALEVSKENIQPLRQGRIASQLSAALQAQTDTSILNNLHKKKEEYELLIRTYDGDDPLQIWFEYVEWVEQTFPKHGKEGNLITLLQSCLTRFKDSEEYFQDLRFVKLWLKYTEMVENSLELYSQLHSHGIGTQCAIFYISWANELFENDDAKQADKVFIEGLRRKAQPMNKLTRAHENFQIAVARRLLDSSVGGCEAIPDEEERKVGNVLATHGKKQNVPSVRIGEKVKLNFPGSLRLKENFKSRRNTERICIYEAENDPEIGRSTNKLQTVPRPDILKKENTKNPTPWSGVTQRIKTTTHTSRPSFQVLGDDNAESVHSTRNVVSLNALRPKKKDDGFYCPIAVFEPPNPNQRAMYPKDQVYAGGTEYSLEELRAVKYLKRKFTAETSQPVHICEDGEITSTDSSSSGRLSVISSNKASSLSAEPCADTIVNSVLDEKGVLPANKSSDIDKVICIAATKETLCERALEFQNNNNTVDCEQEVKLQGYEKAVFSSESNLNNENINNKQCCDNSESFIPTKSPVEVYNVITKNQHFMEQDTFAAQASQISTDWPVTNSPSTEATSNSESEEHKVGYNSPLDLVEGTNSTAAVKKDAIVAVSDEIAPLPSKDAVEDCVTTVSESFQLRGACEDKVRGKTNRLAEFPIFIDNDEICETDRQTPPICPRQTPQMPYINTQISQSMISGQNNQISDIGRDYSSTTKKNKVAPFPLFFDDSRVEIKSVKNNEPCSTKRELFGEFTVGPLGKNNSSELKENIAAVPAYVPVSHSPVSQPTVTRKEVIKSENIVTATMLKFKKKKATEQIKDSCSMKPPVYEECEQQIPSAVVPRKSDLCIQPSMSANSEEVLKVINECWASPPKNNREAEYLTSPNFMEGILEENGTNFVSPHIVPSGIGVRKLSPKCMENKENAIPLCTDQPENVADCLESAYNVQQLRNPISPNNNWMKRNSDEQKEFDESCCTFLFSKTLVSSTPTSERIKMQTTNENSPFSAVESEEFKIPREFETPQLERINVFPRPEILSVIMESSKENKLSSSSGSSSGTLHRAAYNSALGQMESVPHVFEAQDGYAQFINMRTRKFTPCQDDSPT